MFSQPHYLFLFSFPFLSSCYFLHSNFSFSPSPLTLILASFPSTHMFHSFNYLFFPQDTFNFETLSACSLSFAFLIQKAPFQYFLSLILCKGELNPKFGTVEPSSCPRPTTVPYSIHFYFFTLAPFTFLLVMSVSS